MKNVIIEVLKFISERPAIILLEEVSDADSGLRKEQLNDMIFSRLMVSKNVSLLFLRHSIAFI